MSLLRTSTLAAYHDGLEHYVTSFEFASGAETFGSIIPLPGRPSKVERAGDWTLQRLQQEVRPGLLEEGVRRAAASGDKVEVLEQVRIDSLDVTILRGGGHGVTAGRTSRASAQLDTPEVLEFYAERSPFFMAAKFDASAAPARASHGGDGTPVHLTIPLDDPWVPLRILGTASRVTRC